MTWLLTGSLTTSKSEPDPGLLLFPSVFSAHQTPFWVLKALHHERLRVSHSMAGGPQILAAIPVQKKRPGLEDQDRWEGRRRWGRRGSEGRKCCSTSTLQLGLSLQSQHLRARVVSTDPARCSRGLCGRRGTQLTPSCSCLNHKSPKLSARHRGQQVLP